MQLHIANATIHLTLPAESTGRRINIHNVIRAAAPDVSPPAHGEIWPGQGGRFVCTVAASADLPMRHLIMSEGEAEGLAYGPYTDVPGATSHLDGPANTAALMATGKEHPAAAWANAYTADGHNDFHLPSRHELVMAFIHAAAHFKKRIYFSSAQVSRYDAFVQDFEDGGSDWYYKASEHRIRAFRWIRLNA